MHAGERGALASMCTPRSIVRPAGKNTPGCDRGENDDKHLGGVRDMQILTGNHRFSVKNKWPVNRAKILSFHWVAAGRHLTQINPLID